MRGLNEIFPKFLGVSKHKPAKWSELPGENVNSQAAGRRARQSLRPSQIATGSDQAGMPRGPHGAALRMGLESIAKPRRAHPTTAQPYPLDIASSNKSSPERCQRTHRARCTGSQAEKSGLPVSSPWANSAVALRGVAADTSPRASL